MAGAVTSQGEGWWQASDGLWYPPESAAPPPAPVVAYSGVSTVAGAITPVGNGRRFLAYLLEGLLVVVTLFIGWLIWSLIVWGDGKTPAKQVMGMRCVKTDTGRSATWGTMFLREIVGKGVLGAITFGITTVVSIFMILFGPERRGVWDHVAGTVVVDD